MLSVGESVILLRPVGDISRNSSRIALAAGPHKLAQDGRDARAHYEKFHRSEILEECLNGRQVEGSGPTALKSGFSPEPNEWAVWAERQLSCRRVVQRAWVPIVSEGST